MAATKAELLRLLDKLEGQISPAFLASARAIRDRAQIAAMVAAIEAGDINALVLASGFRPGSWTELTESIRAAYIEAGVFIVGTDVPARFGMAFDWTNPRAAAWLREHSSQLVTFINREQREAIQEVLAAGVNAGRNPRSIALDIVGRMNRATGRREGGVIGLNAPQAQAALNARTDLENLDSRYFTRQRRDRRFDSMVRKAIESGTPLSDTDINRIVGRYEDRLLNLRGETVGRTEALQSMNEASDEALRQVIDEGIAEPSDVKKVWQHSGGRNERPGHVAMAGDVVGIEERFVNPVTGVAMKYPGDGPASEVINCRCVVRHQVDYAAQAERRFGLEAA